MEEDPDRTYLKVRDVDEEVQYHEHIPLWSIRRCNSATCEGRRWNRDHNAAINIRANLLHYLNNGTWPQHGNANDADETTATTNPVGTLGTSNSTSLCKPTRKTLLPKR